jgi:hypothetical protein
VHAVELATLILDEETGRPITHILKPAEIDALLTKHGLKKSDAPAEPVSAQARNTDMTLQ